MKKYLLKSSMLMALAFCSTATAWADNVVYGLTSGYDENRSTVFQKVSVDLDSLNKGVVKTENIGETFKDISGFKCGVSVGDKYLAFVSTKDTDGSTFVSINFTTGKIVTINDFSYGYGKPGYNVGSMTYDEVNNKLYAIEKVYGDDDMLKTHLYEVNPTDGAITDVATLDTIYTSVGSDHKGGLYLTKGVLKGWWPQPQLMKLNADYTTSLVVANTKFSGSSESNTLLTSEDGKKVYYSFGVNNLIYDLQGDSVSNVKSSNSLFGLSYGKSSADGETQEKPYEPEKQTRFLVASYTYSGIGKTGDDISVQALTGALPSELDARHTYYYYNTDGKLVAALGEVRNLATKTTFANTCKNESLTKNSFDENGNITEANQYQWGVYNFESYCWKKNSSATTTYEYDDNNRVAKEIGYDTHYYTYNDDGTVAVDSVVASLSKVRKSVTRYEYENHTLVSYEYDGTYEAYNCYLDYDDAGNKVAEIKYSAATEIDPEGEGYTKFKTDDAGNRIYVPTQKQTWEYEGANLVASKIYQLDDDMNETITDKISYTPVEEGNYDDVVMRDSSLFMGKWSELYAPQRFVYKDMSDVKADDYKVNLQVVADEDNLNTAVLGFTLPQIANMRLPKFVIFRDATPIDTVDALSVMDPSSDMCVYVDSTRLENGTYTYFVLPIFEVQNGGEPGGDIWMSLDEDTDTPAAEETEYESYYCSNPASITFNTELPHVTDFKMVGGEDVKSGTSFNRTHTYYGIFSWKNAPDAEKYGLISNKIYLVGTSAPQDSKLSTADSVSVKFQDDEDVCLVTRYELGYVCSDTISVKLADVKLASGVESVTVDGAVKATFGANVVTLSEPANVAVFAANGQQVYGDKNTTSVSLANLPAATYVVVVEKNGKTKAYKYSTK